MQRARNTLCKFIDLVARFAWQQWDSFIDYASARLANVKNIQKKKKVAEIKCVWNIMLP